MWSYIKMPAVPGIGTAYLDDLYVSPGDVIEPGHVIAAARTDHFAFDIVSNYRGRILEVIRSPSKAPMAFGEPLAKLELLKDPEMCAPPIQFWRER
jgi:pyruvate/2-oxoglutarate dehydrogenase complex dihydrolipoamide acyltransferase (E2) component